MRNAACVCLHNHHLLVVFVADLHHCVLVCVKRYKSRACGIVQADLYVGVCQAAAEIVKFQCEEVAGSPITGDGAVGDIFKRSLYLVAVYCYIFLDATDCGVKDCCASVYRCNGSVSQFPRFTVIFAMPSRYSAQRRRPMSA